MVHRATQCPGCRKAECSDVRVSSARPALPEGAKAGRHVRSLLCVRHVHSSVPTCSVCLHAKHEEPTCGLRYVWLLPSFPPNLPSSRPPRPPFTRQARPRGPRCFLLRPSRAVLEPRGASAFLTWDIPAPEACPEDPVTNVRRGLASSSGRWRVSRRCSFHCSTALTLMTQGPPLQTPAKSSEAPRPPMPLSNYLHISGVPTYPLLLRNSLDRLTELTKVLYL